MRKVFFKNTSKVSKLRRNKNLFDYVLLCCMVEVLLPIVGGVQNCVGGPRNVRVLKGNSPNTASVTWDVSGITCQLSGFEIKYDSVKPLRISGSKNVSASSTSYVIPVTPSFSYRVNVFGVIKNTGEEEGPRDAQSYTAPKAPPGLAPGSIHVTSKNHTSITIAWDELNIIYRNGIILGYRVAYQRNGKTYFGDVNGEKNTQYTISGLSPGEKVNFVIQALNDAGKGPYSSPVLFISEPITTTQKPVTGALPVTSVTKATSNQVVQSKASSSPSPTSTVFTSSKENKVTTAKLAGNTKVTTATRSSSTGEFQHPVTKVQNNDTQNVADDEGGGRTNNLPVILAIVGATLLLLAILIPLMFFLCRYCCKTTVVPDRSKDDKKPIHREFQNLDSDTSSDSSSISSGHLEQKAQIQLQTNSTHHAADRLKVAMVSVIDIEPISTDTSTRPEFKDIERPLPAKRLPRENNSKTTYMEHAENVSNESTIGRPRPTGQWEPRYLSQVHLNTVKDNHISHTNNLYIHNFMKLGSIFQRKKKAQEPSIQYQSPRAFYDEFIDTMDERPMYTPHTDGLTSYTYHGSPVIEPRKNHPRAIIEEVKP